MVEAKGRVGHSGLAGDIYKFIGPLSVDDVL